MRIVSKDTQNLNEIAGVKCFIVNVKMKVLCRICIKMHTKWWFLGDSPYFYAMLYAKMFHGYDIL